MARPPKATQQAGGGSSTGEPLTTFFRKIFAENPELLDTRSNEEVMRRWQEDNPGAKVTDQVKAALGNAKSAERSKRRKKRGGRPKGKRPAEVAVAVPAGALAPTGGPGQAGGRAGLSRRSLESLEEQIDECMDLAKHIDREGLDGILKILRRARSEVVWKMG
jgi:hypothetical protein